MAVLGEAVRAAQIVETIENYARADGPLIVPLDPLVATKVEGAVYCGSDRDFWSRVFNHPLSHFGTTFQLGTCFISEWIARVPGLYWMPQSRMLREVSSDQIESRSAEWTTYHPPGKSQKVIGGVGTLRLAPNESGHRLMTLTTDLNASSGIPALVTPNVWDRLRGTSQADGRVLDYVFGVWRSMGDTEWSKRFPVFRGIPRGYLVLDEHCELSASDQFAPVRFDPFAVMEYVSGNAKLCDFVYYAADLGDRRWRSSVELFFEDYKSREGRFGTYLTNADESNPMWDAEINSPEAMRQSLNLIDARVRRRLQGADVVTELTKALGAIVGRGDELRQYSELIGVAPTLWARDGRLVDQIGAFVAEIERRPGKIEELLSLLPYAGYDSWTGNDTLLRDLLAEVCPATSRINMIVDEAGLNRVLIDFDGTPISIWHNVVRQAKFQGKRSHLVAALQEFSGNPEVASFLRSS